jgi:hypothetical protein
VDKKLYHKAMQMAGISEYDYNHPLSETSMKELVKKASVDYITIGEDKSMYVYVPKEQHYTQKQMHQIRDRIVEAFGEVYPNTKIFVGYQRLEFREIDNKTAFKGKLKGTML